MAKKNRSNKTQTKKVKVETKKSNISSKKQNTSFFDMYLNNYKVLLIIPMILLLLSILIIGQKVVTTGDFVNKGVSLAGGVSITINTNVDISEIDSSLQNTYPEAEFANRKIISNGEQTAVIIETSDITAEELTSFLQTTYNLNKNDLAIEQTGSTLGDRFFKQTLMAILTALIFMGIVVFLYFRTLVPSLAIMLAAASDIIMTLAVFNLLDLRLTTAGIAAFLMLIGYSVDTDILLSTRVLKRKEGTVNERIKTALSTGFMMNITTMSALAVGLLLSKSEVITQIMTILFIGLVFDMINTWIQNVGILKYYLEKKGDKK